MDDERDLLVFTDENGEEIQMEVLDYFEYEGQEYAILVEAEDCCGLDHEHEHDDCCECGHEEGAELFIMKVVVDGDTEEFVPVEEEKMDELIEVIEQMYNEEDAGDDEE